MTTFRRSDTGGCLGCEKPVAAHGPQGECPTSAAEVEANIHASRLLPATRCPFCGWVSMHPPDRTCGHCRHD